MSCVCGWSINWPASPCGAGKVLAGLRSLSIHNTMSHADVYQALPVFSMHEWPGD